ncbi:LacI family DNA-binding transcriptional regulator [soil metagenome]
MNIKAVAQKARVSTATVSRTINGSATVSPKTAERVRRAIDLLGFYPDVNARALGSGRSSLYGLIISDITNPFFPELVKAFEDVAVEHKQEILIANTNYDPARMENCVIRMLQRKVDGVAIMTSEMDDKLIEVFSRRHIPLVLLDAGSPAPGVSSVRFDYHGGIVAAMHHLLSLQHRRIAFISGPMTLASAQVRFNAFTEILTKNDLSINKSLMAEGNHRVDGGYQAMKRILTAKVLPTAVICSNDLTAIGSMSAIFEHGLRVPEDISVVGYDDIQLSAHTHPSLTTLRLPRTELANRAFHNLFDKRTLAGKQLPMGEAHIFHPKLMVRESTSTAKP